MVNSYVISLFMDCLHIMHEALTTQPWSRLVNNNDESMYTPFVRNWSIPPGFIVYSLEKFLAGQ